MKKITFFIVAFFIGLFISLIQLLPDKNNFSSSLIRKTPLFEQVNAQSYGNVKLSVKDIISSDMLDFDNPRRQIFNYISGFNEIGNSGHTEDSSGYSFNGLGKSDSGSCAIDGDGHSHTNWFNCVGVINKIWGAMPGPLRKTSTTMKLYIWSSDN